MGRKRSRAGQHLYLYAALLMCLGLSITGCAGPLTGARLPEQTGHEERPAEAAAPARDAAAERLIAARHYLETRNYEASVREAEAVLSLSPGTPPADEAVFIMALVYASPGNPKKDYSKAIALFTIVSSNYPQGGHADAAKVWTEVLRENIQLRQTTAEALRENDRLKKVLRESNKIDLDIGEKIRGKTR